MSGTTYVLKHGSDKSPSEARRFTVDKMNDAITRFALKVVEFDQDPETHAAWVHLLREPDPIFPEGLTMAAWTKTSDECPTTEGTLIPN